MPRSGFLEQVHLPDGQVLVENLAYTPTGKTKGIVFDNGLTTTYGYDSETDRLTSLITSNDLQNFAYKYTPAGDIDEITDRVDGVTRSYQYDHLHRLLSESSSGENPPSTRSATLMTYEYEAEDTPGVHNVKTIEEVSSKKTVRHQFSYDKKGNMTSGPNLSRLRQVQDRAIDWNAANMPLRVAIGGVEKAAFKYDGNQERAVKREDGVETFYFGEKFEIIDGVSVKYIFNGNLRAARIKGDTLCYYHKDHLGSSTVMTDSEGAQVGGRASYMPFGLGRSGVAGMVDANYLFTDQEKDVAIGLYNYDARLYSPGLGMFVSADSVVPGSFDPQGLNRYAYCRNNPLQYMDPTGHSWSDGKGVTGAIGNACRAIGRALGGVFGGKNKNNDNNTGLSNANASTAGASIPGLVGPRKGFPTPGEFGEALGRNLVEGAKQVTKVGRLVKAANIALDAVEKANQALATDEPVKVENKKKGKPSSAGKMDQEVKKGKAPKGIKRVDKGKYGSEDHIHYDDGTSSTISGGIHDKHRGTPKPNKKQNKWIEKHNWTPFKQDSN